jgi:hypothetical protein
LGRAFRIAEIFDAIAAEYDKWYTDEVGSTVHDLEREMVLKSMDRISGKLFSTWAAAPGFML